MRSRTRAQLAFALGALAAVNGCRDVPDVVDATPDRYLEMRPSPDRMVGSNGNYLGGWYSEFTGRFNPDDASGDDYTFKKWLHFNIDDPSFYLAAQLVVTDIAGNVAIAIADKKTGQLHDADVVYSLGDEVAGDSEARSFTDSATGSFIKLEGGVLTFDVKANDLRVTGSAQEIFERPLVQITRYQDGYGDLMFWGNTELIEGTLTIAGSPSTLAPGSLGLYDRQMGHKRTTLNWNYVAASGQAASLTTGRRAPFALQGSVDLPRTRPRVAHEGHGVWLDGRLGKPSEIHFDYAIVDGGSRTTGDWHLWSPPGEAISYDLTLTPPPGRDKMFHRRNRSSSLWFFERDFNQYYGVIHGTLTVDGEVWQVDDVYALVEDAYVVL